MTGNAISFVSMLHTAEYAVVALDHMTRILSAALAEDWHVCSWDVALCRFRAGRPQSYTQCVTLTKEQCHVAFQAGQA